MKPIVYLLSLALVSLPLLGGCGEGGLKTGNGANTPQISLEATSSNVAAPATTQARGVPGELVGFDQQNTRFVVESARASVSEIEIELPGVLDCGDFDENEVDDDESVVVQCEDDSVEIDGMLVADLVNRTFTPAIPQLPFPIATYEYVRVQFEPADQLPGTDPLSNLTIYATGRFHYDGSDRTFEFALDFSESATFEDMLGVPFGDLGETLRLRLDVADWFSALPITDCLDNGDLMLVNDHLLLSDGSGGCSDIENALKTAISGSSELDSDDGEDD